MKLIRFGDGRTRSASGRPRPPTLASSPNLSLIAQAALIALAAIASLYIVLRLLGAGR